MIYYYGTIKKGLIWTNMTLVKCDLEQMVFWTNVALEQMHLVKCDLEQMVFWTNVALEQMHLVKCHLEQMLFRTNVTLVKWLFEQML